MSLYQYLNQPFPKTQKTSKILLALFLGVGSLVAGAIASAALFSIPFLLGLGLMLAPSYFLGTVVARFIFKEMCSCLFTTHAVTFTLNLKQQKARASSFSIGNINSTSLFLPSKKPSVKEMEADFAKRYQKEFVKLKSQLKSHAQSADDQEVIHIFSKYYTHQVVTANPKDFYPIAQKKVKEPAFLREVNKVHSPFLK